MQQETTVSHRLLLHQMNLHGARRFTVMHEVPPVLPSHLGKYLHFPMRLRVLLQGKSPRQVKKTVFGRDEEKLVGLKYQTSIVKIIVAGLDLRC